MSDDYVLGTDPKELERLRFQHVVWVQHAYAVWQRAGFRGGDTLLDLGSGPGFTTFDLANLAGPEGRVIAVDRSRSYLAALARERDRRGLSQIETRVAEAADLDLPAASLDGAYARWVLCWLEDPGGAIARVAAALKPGAAFVVQDYVDWAAMKLLPPSAVFDRGVAACMQSWRDARATIDIGDRLPELAAAAGLQVEHLAPIARIGAVGSLEWRWLDEFFEVYLPKLVPRLLSEDELAAHRAEMDARTRSRTGWCVTPTVVDVILRKR